MSRLHPAALASHPVKKLSGVVQVIGDKSLTHRALMFAALAKGRSEILHPNPGEDCDGTAAAISQLGAKCQRSAEGWAIDGFAGSFRNPVSEIDLGNSGTGIRLLSGLIIGQGGSAILTGDSSLRRRPMRRIAEPLRKMGATVSLHEDQYPPVTLRGGGLEPISYRLPVASAQIKSSILLAGLGLRDGELLVEEPGPSRDHTERFLAWLGADLVRDRLRVTLRTPVPGFDRFRFRVPGDPSAATFYLVAASIVEGADVTIEGVNLNPTRTGAIDCLRSMGAALEIVEEENDLPEPTGTIRVRSAPLKGTTVGGDHLVRALDEVPILAVAAALAEGETLFRDAGELRVKESDRIESTASLVRSLGAQVETGETWMRIQGAATLRGASVSARGDHRIAMSAIVAGCAAEGPVQLDDARAISTSDPEFLDSLARLGADLR